MTCVFIAVPDGTGYFNPHPHVEGDAKPLPTPVEDEISIHTLTWRVTSNVSNSDFVNAYFNPRPHVEGDFGPISYATVEQRFQSTPSRGG